MFTATLLITGNKLKNSNVHQLVNEYINVVYPCSGTVFVNKKEWSSNTLYNMDGPWKHIK